MKINWSFIEPVRDQATRLRNDLPAQSAIVKLAEQQAEIERLREENARLREALKPFADKKYAYEGWADIARAEVWLNVRDIRAAAAALKEAGDE